MIFLVHDAVSSRVHETVHSTAYTARLQRGTQRSNTNKDLALNTAFAQVMNA